MCTGRRIPITIPSTSPHTVTKPTIGIRFPPLVTDSKQVDFLNYSTNAPQVQQVEHASRNLQPLGHTLCIADRAYDQRHLRHLSTHANVETRPVYGTRVSQAYAIQRYDFGSRCPEICLLYTSDAADDL